MQKINYPEFVEFFQSKIVPEVQPYEKYRIKLCKKLTFIPVTIFIKVVFIFITFWIWIFGVRIIGNAGNDAAGVYVLIWTLVCFFTIYFFGGSIFDSFGEKKHLKRTYKTTTKYAFYEKIFNLLGLNYTNKIDAQINIKNQISKINKQTGILGFYNDINSDDIISGDYNNLPFTVSDVEIYYETTDGRDRVFYGLFLAIKIDKPYKGETIIKTDTFLQTDELKGKNVIKLEDIEFEKYFEVYGTDQVESRYILTPAFMRRLVDYRKQKYCPIEVVFSNEIGLDKNLFLFVHTGKNHFELPMDISLLNQDSLYGLIKEITDILDIVDTLKLDQNIGL